MQYVLLLPTTVNLVSVYAFCNIHDVPWGFTGTTEQPLESLGGVAQTEPGNVKVKLLLTDGDLDEYYNSQTAFLHSERSTGIKRAYSLVDAVEHHYRNLRTLTVFAWISSNVVLAAFMINFPAASVIRFGPALQTTQGSVVFIALIFWRFALDAVIKFVGAILYLLLSKFLGWRWI